MSTTTTEPSKTSKSSKPPAFTPAVWRAVRPHITAHPYGRDGGVDKPRVRLEVRAPADVLRSLSELVTPCCHCGAPIHPVRLRQKTAAPGAPSPRRLPSSAAYLAVSCVGSSKPCSKGEAAAEAYRSIKRAIGYVDPDHPFLALFRRVRSALKETDHDVLRAEVGEVIVKLEAL